MTMQKALPLNFDIQVTSTYIVEESKPDQNYFFFSYKVTIRNKGSQMAQLMSRHWIITDSFGRNEEVRGPGVVGLQPKIQPGQTFEYESACPLATATGSMKGFYSMVTEAGETIQVEIPEFWLVSPQALH
ncbi:MAG: Co2+/Mg2+ efflux protein ApaG [Bdellovibrionales bacterium]